MIRRGCDPSEAFLLHPMCIVGADNRGHAGCEWIYTTLKSACLMSKAIRRSVMRRARTHEEWTFMDKSTTHYTHAMHLYPARMHPEIARRVIAKYAPDHHNVVLDPFVGSGGVLLEAILHGNNAIGIDINPFAILLSKVKTTLVNKNLVRALDKITLKAAADCSKQICYSDDMPELLDLETWYKPSLLNALAALRHHVFQIRDLNVRDFFKICFSLTSRKVSYQRNGSWKIHRMSANDRRTFALDPLTIFSSIAKSNICRMSDLLSAKPKGVAYAIHGDSRDITSVFSSFNHGVLEDKKAHLVVTSPPYGDHKTTVAYGQFSRHLGLWLGLPADDVLHVDRNGLGGRSRDYGDLGSDTLNTTLDKVEKNDLEITRNNKPHRTREVYSFFYDLDQCMREVSCNLVRRKSHCCFVVANRTVRRVRVPTDQITVELGKKYGLRTRLQIPRMIPNKVLPTKNAPENISHNTCETMTKEMVIIMSY